VRLADPSRGLGRSTPIVLAVACVGLGCHFAPAKPAPTTGTGGTSTITGTGGSTGLGGSGGTGPTSLSSLMITPASATLMVTAGGPTQTQQYMVTGVVNGSTQDLTNQVTYSASPAGIVTMDNHGLATATAAIGGVVTITAAAGSAVTSATLTVYLNSSGPDPGMTATVPPDASTHFTSTTNDSTRAPQLVYPNDGVLFPPNISGVEIHFQPGANNTLFEVAFVGMYSTVKSYVRCTAPTGITGCIYTPDPSIWTSVASSNAGQGPVSLTVRGTDDNGGSVGASQTFHMTFAKDPVMGAIYYWNTSGKTAIMRWGFGETATMGQTYLTPTNTDGTTCVGCHALSPDGKKLVATAGGQGDGRVLLWDVVNNKALQPFPLGQKSQFESWNSDGSQFVGVYGDGNPGSKGPSNLMIFDGTSGQVTSTIDLGGLRADHPDWTKNATATNTIVFTSVDPTAATSDQRPSTGGISYVQQMGGTWQQPQTLVPSLLGKNRYYPSIAPDGNLVIYDESTCTNGTPTLGQPADKSCDADTDPTATMFLTSLGGATPIALTNANSPGVADNGNTVLTNSYPRWAPFIQKLDELHQIIWVTFSSTRQYGLRAPSANTFDPGENPTDELIWMFAIMVGPSGTDPSYTAFCLPFQDITTGNHIAQWTQVLINPPG